MKINKIIYLFLLLSLVSCEDYLDRQGSNTDLLTEDEIFTDPERLLEYADRLYDCALSWTFEGRWNLRVGGSGLGEGKNYTSISQCSGEVISFRPILANVAAIPGDFDKLCNPNSYGDPEFSYSWQDCWEGIYIANLLISKFDAGEVANVSDEEYNRTLGTAYTMRAHYYAEIIARWGAVPYFSERMSSLTNFDVQQENYDSIVARCVRDCDMGAALIPEVSYLNDELHMGRIGKAAALAVKSRMLNVAASKLNNPTNDLRKWEAAAAAAWDIIKLSQDNPTKIGLYKINDDPDFEPTAFEGKYNNMFWGLPGTVEDLFPRYYPEAHYGVYHILWQWTANGNCTSALGSSPTMEYVDLFETSDGLPIFDTESKYTDDHPFLDRDPRFEYDLFHHGSTWDTDINGDTLNMMTSPKGEDRAEIAGADFGNSKTGYLVKKVLPKSQNAANQIKVYINAPFIRMAEMYLNYAEAVNEAYGSPSTSRAPGATMSASDALDKIRLRVGHVPVPGKFTADQELFRQRVRNEFKVELMFEYHAWRDMMRWKTAEDELDNHNFHGMLLTEDASKPEGIRYERFELPLPRAFKERNYRYPFFSDDMLTFDNLKQNPGW